MPGPRSPRIAGGGADGNTTMPGGGAGTPKGTGMPGATIIGKGDGGPPPPPPLFVVVLPVDMLEGLRLRAHPPASPGCSGG